MITAGDRLAFLSGLTGVSAYQHLRQIAGFYGVAAAMLVAFSGYPTAPAWVHLFPPESQESASGSAGRVSSEWTPSKRKREVIEATIRALPLAAADRDAVTHALFAFFAAGGVRAGDDGREAIRSFLDKTILRLQRVDLHQRADSQQFVEDQLDAIAQQRVDNRRRAMILVALMMLS